MSACIYLETELEIRRAYRQHGAIGLLPFIEAEATSVERPEGELIHAAVKQLDGRLASHFDDKPSEKRWEAPVGVERVSNDS